LPAADPADARQRILGPESQAYPVSGPPSIGRATRAKLILRTTRFGADLPMRVLLNGCILGETRGGTATFEVPSSALIGRDDAEVALVSPAEGAWLLCNRAELIIGEAKRRLYRVARWDPVHGGIGGEPGITRLCLGWIPPETLGEPMARFLGKDLGLRGQRGVFTPGGTVQTGPEFSLDVEGALCDWQVPSADPRAFGGAARCWFGPEAVTLSLTPKDNAPYRVTLYILDFDRNRRAMQVSVENALGDVDVRPATADETDRGVSLTWDAQGPITASIRKTAGYNAVLSAVLID
jgi:hypothetical protein